MSGFLRLDLPGMTASIPLLRRLSRMASASHPWSLSSAAGSASGSAISVSYALQSAACLPVR